MKDLTFLKQNLIAHRGYHNAKIGIPENSLLAFDKAVENNYIIELDVHILKDNSIVVFHDDCLERMTGLRKNIKDITYDEIKKLNLGNTNYKIPLLTEVLTLIDGRVPLIIELKTDVKVGILEEELVKILEKYTGKYAVKSFSPFSVYWFKKNYPDIIRGQLSAGFEKDKMFSLKKIFLKNMKLNFLTKPDFISYSVNSLPNKVVEEFRKENLVLGWTVRNKEQFKKGMKYCDNLICENFDEL